MTCYPALTCKIWIIAKIVKIVYAADWNEGWVPHEKRKCFTTPGGEWAGQFGGNCDNSENCARFTFLLFYNFYNFQ